MEGLHNHDRESLDSSASVRRKKTKMPLANLIMGVEQFELPEIQSIQERLGAAGILSYKIPVEGAGDPEMELAGASYFGTDEINQGIDSFIASK